MAFNPGDKVKRIGSGWHELKSGDIVTVVTDAGNNLTCKEFPYVFSSDMFVLVTADEPIPKIGVGDKVVRKEGYCNGLWPDTVTVYTVMETRKATNMDGSPTYKIRVNGRDSFWFVDKFSFAPAAPFEPVIGTIARIKPQGPWKTEGVQMEDFAGKFGAITQNHGGNFRIASISTYYWWRKEDLIDPAENYVPPVPRKVKVYNAERKSHV